MDLSIIILSYNTKDITDECLKRLQVSVDRLQKNDEKVEVVVLDNASSDGSAEMIKKNHPWVKLIELNVNTGFGKGNNLAFKKSKHPYILFLNSDVYVNDDTLEKSLKYFSDHNCDVLGIKMTYENGQLQPSAGYLPTPINIIFWILGLGRFFNPFHPKSSKFFSSERQVGWVMGAFLLIKGAVFTKAGKFDENIFMYMDEVDLCKRIHNLGFKICYTPSPEVIHLHRASSKDNPQKAFVLEIKGIKIYLKKYYSWYEIIKFILIIGLILRIVAFSLIGKTKRARAYIEALGEV